MVQEGKGRSKWKVDKVKWKEGEKRWRKLSGRARETYRAGVLTLTGIGEQNPPGWPTLLKTIGYIQSVLGLPAGRRTALFWIIDL